MCFVAICINLSLKCKKWRSGNESMKSYIEDILQGWNKHLLRYMFFSKDWKTYEHGELGILERENGNTLIVRVLSKPRTTLQDFLAAALSLRGAGLAMVKISGISSAIFPTKDIEILKVLICIHRKWRWWFTTCFEHPTNILPN